MGETEAEIRAFWRAALDFRLSAAQGNPDENAADDVAVIAHHTQNAKIRSRAAQILSIESAAKVGWP